ncbi:MAG: hypothetical protein P8H38_08400 [Flavobacteriaceae bacterium]|nr:hypothetical protein [Flavobacteriaceae bacterium]
MVANLFRKTNLSSFTGSFLGTFLVLFLFQTNQRFNVDSFLSISTNALVKAILVLVFLLLLSYFKNKDRFLKISPFLALSFPLVLLFIPHESLQLDGLVLNGLVIIVFINLATSEKAKNVLKPLFNSALILSILVFLEGSFSYLFLSLALFFFAKNIDLLRVLTAILVPFFSVYFLMKTGSILYGFDVWSIPWPVRTDLQEQTKLEFLTFLGFEFLIISLIVFSKSSLRKIGFTVSTAFLLILIFSGVILGFIEKTGHFNLYEIVFFPSVYYLSIALEEQSNIKINGLVILLVIIKASSYFF